MSNMSRQYTLLSEYMINGSFIKTEGSHKKIFFNGCAVKTERGGG